MARFTARLKLPPARRLSALAQGLKREEDPPPRDPESWSRRANCGAVFPFAGQDRACSQVLGTEVLARFALDLAIVETTVRPARGEPGVGDDGDSWILAPYNGHFHRERDGTYRLVSGRARPEVAGRRHSALPSLTRNGPLVRVDGFPIGRRGMPPEIEEIIGPYWSRMNADGARAVLGHYPVLPAVVRCPRCSQENVVERPTPDQAAGKNPQI